MTDVLAVPPTLEEVLEASAAEPAFKDAVRRLRERVGSPDGAPLRFNRVSPPVKVLRVVTALMHRYPAWRVASVDVEGFSGCSEYVGKAAVATADGEHHVVEFHWDCAWKATTLGWRDMFGLPDQIRAARTFDWDCFRSWEVRSPTAASAKA